MLHNEVLFWYFRDVDFNYRGMYIEECLYMLYI